MYGWRVAYRILVRKPEAKRPVETARRRWKDNKSIKMDLQEMGWEDMDRIDPAQNRDRWRALVNVLMNFRVP